MDAISFSETVPLPCRLVVSDFDGTLVNSSREFTTAVLQAAAALQQRGIPLVLASGREWMAIAPYYRKLRLQTPYIGANGGFIYFPADDRVLKETFLPVHAQRSMLHELHSYRLAVFCSDQRGVYFSGDRVILQAQAMHAPFEVVLCDDLSSEGPERLHKLTLRGSPEELERFRGQALQTAAGVQMVFSDSTCLEVIPAGVNKGDGVRLVLEHLAVDPEDVVVIGDGMNDLPMLSVAGTAVAMGNAPDEVLAAAHFSTASSDEDGAAVVLDGCILKPL